MVARFLVVDRDPATRVMLAVALYASGYDIETAADKSEALRKIRLEPPDAVFLGQAPTTSDGWSLLSACSEEPGWNGMAVVPIPANWRETATVKELRSEVDQFLTTRNFHLR